MELDRKTLRRLRRELEDAGWRIEETKSGFKCKSPDGKKTVQIHNTTSEYRAGKNILSQLRQGGFEFNGKR